MISLSLCLLSPPVSGVLYDLSIQPGTLHAFPRPVDSAVIRSRPMPCPPCANNTYERVYHEVSPPGNKRLHRPTVAAEPPPGSWEVHRSSFLLTNDYFVPTDRTPRRHYAHIRTFSHPADAGNAPHLRLVTSRVTTAATRRGPVRGHRLRRFPSPGDVRRVCVGRRRLQLTWGRM